MTLVIDRRSAHQRRTDGVLTDRQAELLEFIASNIESRGFPPSIREMGAELDIGSYNGTVDHLKALVKKGAIERERQVSRGIRITPRGRQLLEDWRKGRAA